MTEAIETIRVDYVSKPLVELDSFGNLIEVASTQFEGVILLDDPETWAADVMTAFEVDKISRLTSTQAEDLELALDEVRGTRDELIVRNVQKVIAVFPKKLVVNLDDTDEQLGDERRDVLNVFSQITGKALPYHPLRHCLHIGSFVESKKMAIALRQLREVQPGSIALGKTVADLTVGGVEKSV